MGGMEGGSIGVYGGDRDGEHQGEEEDDGDSKEEGDEEESGGLETTGQGGGFGIHALKYPSFIFFIPTKYC